MADVLQQFGLSLPAAIAVVAVAVLIVLAIGLALLLRRKPKVEFPQPNLSLNLATLPQTGPPAEGPQLELYNVPMRLAVVVIAPAGRGSGSPGQDETPDILDQMVPGLAQVVAAQKPLYRGWPGQLSSEGFANTFFANVRLPGDKGKGTPWCALAGRALASDQKYLVGLALCAAQPNHFSQMILERETDWLGALRVRR